MATRDYRRALAAGKRELEDLLAKRERIDQRIAKLKTTMNDLAFLCGGKIDDPAAQTMISPAAKSMGITDLTRLALKTSSRPLTPAEVAHQVHTWRPELDRNHNLLASTHTILKRLVKGGEVEEVPALGRKKAYKWISDVARVLAGLQDIDKGRGFSK